MHDAARYVGEAEIAPAVAVGGQSLTTRRLTNTIRSMHAARRIPKLLLAPMAVLTLFGMSGCGIFVSATTPAPRTFAHAENGLPRAPKPAELVALKASDNPADHALLREVEAGPETLKQERELARIAGLPLYVSELQKRLPPSAENAALEWQRLGELLRRKPVPKKHADLIGRFARRRGESAAEIAAVRRILAARPDIRERIRAAVGKPRCVFSRDWSLGADTPFPEFATMRQGARWLRAESILLAIDGKSSEAVALQAFGYRAARQAASDPTVIAYLVAQAISAISESGLEAILLRQGETAPIVGQVRDVVIRDRPPLSLRHAMLGEGAVTSVAFQAMSNGKPDAFTGSDTIDRSRPFPEGFDFSRLSAEERRLWACYLDATEADYWRNLRAVLPVLELPWAEQRREVGAIDRSLKPNPRPVALYSAIILPVYFQAGEAGVRGMARAAALVTAAEVLLYRIRHARFPERLADLGPDLPQDPWTGRPPGYRREPRGFVVYCVGRDGRYTGGSPDKPADFKEVAVRYP